MSKVYNNSSHMKALLFELNMLWREIGALENHLSFTKGTKTRRDMKTTVCTRVVRSVAILRSIHYRTFQIDDGNVQHKSVVPRSEDFCLQFIF